MLIIAFIIVMFVLVGSALFVIGLIALLVGTINPLFSGIILTALLFLTLTSPVILCKASK